MSLLSRLYPGDTATLLGLNLILQGTLVMACALLLARTALRCRPALRHGVLLCASVTLLFSPAVSWLVTRGARPLIPFALVARVSSPSPSVPHTVTPLGASLSPPVVRNREGVADRSIRLREDAHAPLASRSRPGSATMADALEAPVETPVASVLSWRVPYRAPSATHEVALLRDERLRALVALLTLIWGAGLFVASARFVGGGWQIARLRRALRPLDEPIPSEVLEQVRGALNLHRLPPVVIATELRCPSVVGVWKPLIILPEGLRERLEPGALREVLIHECAHVALHHPVQSLMQRVVSMLFWPLPLVHILGRELARAREEVCDNFVLRQEEAMNYAKTLLSLAERGGRLRLSASLPLLPLRFPLEERIAGLLDPQRDRGTSVPRWQTGIAAGACLLTVATLGVHAAPRPQAVTAPRAMPAPAAPALPLPPAPGAAPALATPTPPAVAAPHPEAPQAVPVPGTPHAAPGATAPAAVPPAPASGTSAPRATPDAPLPPTAQDPTQPHATPPAPQALPVRPELPASDPPLPSAIAGTPAAPPSAPAVTPAAPDRITLPPAAEMPAPTGSASAPAFGTTRNDERRITLKLSKTTLGEALAQLMERAHASYTLDNRLSDERIGAIRLEGIPFRAALETLVQAGARPATYVLSNNIYRVIPRDSDQPTPDASAVGASSFGGPASDSAAPPMPSAGGGTTKAPSAPSVGRSDSIQTPKRDQVTVYGRVLHSGRYAAEAQDRLIDALHRCGGPLPGADLAHITWTHRLGNRTQTETVNLIGFLRGGRIASNPQLTPGSVIYVPERKTASGAGKP